MTEVVFELKGLHYQYQQRYPALSDIDLTIQAGERIAVIGANGTGKSTLLHLLDGLLFPDKGSIRAFNEELNEAFFQDPNRARRFRSRVGLVFQNPDIQLFCPSVREDIAFGPLQLGVDKVTVGQRLEAVAQAMNIMPLLDRIPHQLSIGEKKKVAIATVLAIDPEVIIFDEPTAGLDPQTIRHIIGLINHAHGQGKTIVVATHDLHIVGEIADRVCVFDQHKKIVRQDQPLPLLTDQAFLQAHNLIHLHSHIHGGQFHVHPHSHAQTSTEEGL